MGPTFDYLGGPANAAKRHLLEAGGSALTTPTEESESDASAKRALARKLQETHLAAAEKGMELEMPLVSHPSEEAMLAKQKVAVVVEVAGIRRPAIEARSATDPNVVFGQGLKRALSSPQLREDLDQDPFTKLEPLSQRRMQELATTSRPWLRRAQSVPKEEAEPPDHGLLKDAFAFEQELLKAPQRRRLQRVSSTGTTVYTPSDAGVEVDGIPVGPGEDHWNEILGPVDVVAEERDAKAEEIQDARVKRDKGKSVEGRRERSFL
jgi:hypothetical protein